MTPSELARAIERDLRSRADPARREATTGYFPTGLEILGVSAPDIRGVIRDRDEWRRLGADAVLELAAGLHASGIHEARQAAYEILERRHDAAALMDGGRLRALGAGNDNWASVDAFATRVAGPAWREGRVDDGQIREWAASESRWWRRTAVVCTVALNQKSRGGTGDAARTLDICRRVAADRDPMVAKALSWALRALAVRDGAAVRGFLGSHGDTLAPLVRREVRNKLETGRKNP